MAFSKVSCTVKTIVLCLVFQFSMQHSYITTSRSGVKIHNGPFHAAWPCFSHWTIFKGKFLVLLKRTYFKISSKQGKLKCPLFLMPCKTVELLRLLLKKITKVMILQWMGREVITKTSHTAAQDVIKGLKQTICASICSSLDQRAIGGKRGKFSKSCMQASIRFK